MSLPFLKVVQKNYTSPGKWLSAKLLKWSVAYWCFIPRLNPFCKFLMCIFNTSNSTFIWKKVNVFKTIMMKRYTNFPLFRPMLQSYGNQSNGLCSKFIGWSQWHITGSKPGRVRFQDFLAKALTSNEERLVLLL